LIDNPINIVDADSEINVNRNYVEELEFRDPYEPMPTRANLPPKPKLPRLYQNTV